MKRDDSLLYIPLETEIFPNSKLLNDLRNENLSNSDMDEKSLLSVRISAMTQVIKKMGYCIK